MLNLFAHAVWDKDLNHNSPVQLKSMLYEYLNLPVQIKYEKGKQKVSTDREALEHMIEEYPRARPFCKTIITLRDIDKQERFDLFKRTGEFRSSKYKGIGMDEFYGGPNAVDEKGKHYTSTIEKILKKQAKENNSEMITMPVQVKKGSKSQYQVTDQNGNMVATLTNEDQARELMRTNPNYQIKPISIPDKKSMEPVFAIKITEEMLESFATHKAKGGLVSNIDIFEVA